MNETHLLCSLIDAQSLPICGRVCAEMDGSDGLGTLFRGISAIACCYCVSELM